MTEAFRRVDRVISPAAEQPGRTVAWWERALALLVAAVFAVPAAWVTWVAVFLATFGMVCGGSPGSMANLPIVFVSALVVGACWTVVLSCAVLGWRHKLSRTAWVATPLVVAIVATVGTGISLLIDPPTRPTGPDACDLYD